MGRAENIENIRQGDPGAGSEEIIEINKGRSTQVCVWSKRLILAWNPGRDRAPAVMGCDGMNDHALTVMQLYRMGQGRAGEVVEWGGGRGDGDGPSANCGAVVLM